MGLKKVKDWSIFSKIVLQLVFGFLFFVLFFAFYVIPEMRSNLMAEKKKFLKDAVELAYTIYDGYNKQVEAGEISLEDAQLRAREAILKMRFDSTNYYFVFNDKQMLIQPVSKKREGLPLSKFKDDNDFLYLQAAADITKNAEDGFIEYFRAKPNTEIPLPKLSYFKVFRPWGWISGTGIYYDDVEEQMADISFVMYTALGIIIAFILITVVLLLYFTVTKPIKKLMFNAKLIADGDLDVKFDDSNNDELGQLNKALSNMSGTIKDVITEISRVNEFMDKGQLDNRGKWGNFKGAYADIIKGINSNLDSLIRPLNVAAEYVDRIAKGDIPPKITDEYRGDFNEIKNNLNQAIDSINALIYDTNDLVEASTAGKLNSRAEAMRHSGDFRRIIQGVNATLDRLVGLIDNMPLPVQITDKQFNILYLNKKAEELTN